MSAKDRLSPAIAPRDAMRAVLTIMLPTVAGGAIARRPRVLGAVDRLELDARAIDEMQRLRDRYGPGPVQITPGRRMALLLDPDDVHRVLDETPEPFGPDTREKRGALGHFQPEGVLISSPQERAVRRPFNAEVLQEGRPVHDHAASMSRAVRQEVDALGGHVDFAGHLGWPPFAVAWWRIVRRVVLGDSARDDVRTTDLLYRLRNDANWAYLKPRRTATREEFLASMRRYVDRAEPGSLAATTAAVPAPAGTEPHQQIPQWLFAFDAAAWATVRALALLSISPAATAKVREELAAADPDRPDLPFARACVLESLRLWATTPLILRETTAETRWASGTLEAGTSVVIFAPYFHRSERHVPEANRFAPELWMRERTDADWPLVPFSGGPAMCPGRNVVLMVSSLILARLVAERDLDGPSFDPGAVPASLNPFEVSFRSRRAR